MSIFTCVACDHCKGEFVLAGVVTQAAITDAALEAKWAVWPDGGACCPECCRKLDTSECGDAWRLEAVLAGE